MLLAARRLVLHRSQLPFLRLLRSSFQIGQWHPSVDVAPPCAAPFSAGGGGGTSKREEADVAKWWGEVEPPPPRQRPGQASRYLSDQRQEQPPSRQRRVFSGGEQQPAQRQSAARHRQERPPKPQRQDGPKQQLEERPTKQQSIYQQAQGPSPKRQSAAGARQDQPARQQLRGASNGRVERLGQVPTLRQGKDGSLAPLLSVKVQPQQPLKEPLQQQAPPQPQLQLQPSMPPPSPNVPKVAPKKAAVDPLKDLMGEVSAYLVTHGSLPRPASTPDRQHQLVTYIFRVRKRGKGKVGRPPPEVVQELQAMGSWWWEESEVWQRRLEGLRAFVAEHGRQPRQNKGSQVERGLGKWSRQQRLRRREGSEAPPTPEQVAALESVPGWQW